jgi:hypothetical protein
VYTAALDVKTVPKMQEPAMRNLSAVIGLFGMVALSACAPSGGTGYGPVGVWDAGGDALPGADAGNGNDGSGPGPADANSGNDGGGAGTDIDSPPDPGPVDDAKVDAAPDNGTPLDTAQDVAPDVGADVGADVPVVGQDVPTDAAPDSIQDIIQDTFQDIAKDTGPDIALDTAPDIAKDTPDVPAVNTCGAGKNIKALLQCTEGVVDFYLEKQLVTYVFGQGFLLYDASISRGMMVYLNPNTVTKPKVGDLVDLHVTKYANYNGQQEITGADVLTVVGTGDAAATQLSLNVITKDMVSEAYESRVLIGTGLVVKQLSGADAVLTSPSAGDLVMRIDGPADLCAGAVIDLKVAALTQFGSSHRVHLLNGAGDLIKVDASKCGAAPVHDQSNWGFEEASDADPPPDFTKVGAYIAAARTTTQKYSGTASCKVTWTSVDNQDLVAGQFIPILPGQKASISAWVLDSDPAGKGRLSMTFYKSDMTTVVSSQFSGAYTVDGAQWAQVSFAYTAPAEAAYVRGFMRFYDVAPAFTGSATLYMDDWTTSIQ